MTAAKWYARLDRAGAYSPLCPPNSQYFNNTNESISAFGTNEGAVGLRALGVKELNYRMSFLANNVTVLGLTDQLEGEIAEQSQTEINEIERMKANRNIYQVTPLKRLVLQRFG